MFLNSPRMPSGASGLLSHMSIVAGPPASQTRMTDWAFFLPAIGGASPALTFASAARMPGKVSPSTPAEPTWRKSRRWKDSQSVRNMAHSLVGWASPTGAVMVGGAHQTRSMIQDELPRVDQGPHQLLNGGSATPRSLQMVQAVRFFFFRRLPGERGEEQFLDDLIIGQLLLRQ